MSKPVTNLRVNTGSTWSRRGAVLGLGLLALLPLSFTALDYLVPKAASQDQRASTRAGWYLRSGQWRADVRTIAAAFEYVIDLVPGAPAGTNSPTKQLAAPARPVGPNLPVMTQVNNGGHRFPNC